MCSSEGVWLNCFGVTNVADTFYRKLKHFMFSNSPPQSYCLWENVKKHDNSPTGHVATQYGAEKMRFACQVTKARIMFNIIGSPQLQRLHDRTAMLRYTYIVCLVPKCPWWDWHRVSCFHRCAMLCVSRAVLTTASVVILRMHDRARLAQSGHSKSRWL